MKQTSVEAFELLVNGKLNTVQMSVYHHLLNNGPMTGREINNALGGDSYHKRLSELKRQGMVYEDDVRKCSISGIKATVWAALDTPEYRIPDKRTRPTKAQRAKETTNQIMALIDQNTDLWSIALLQKLDRDEITAIIEKNMR